jgi:hypothetical protein
MTLMGVTAKRSTPIIDGSNILFHCWCWLGTPLQASHAVSLAWRGWTWPRFESRSRVPDLRVLVNQPRYTSQARITQIGQKQYTQHMISRYRLHPARWVGLASWIRISLSEHVGDLKLFPWSFQILYIFQEQVMSNISTISTKIELLLTWQLCHHTLATGNR